MIEQPKAHSGDLGDLIAIRYTTHTTGRPYAGRNTAARSGQLKFLTERPVVHGRGLGEAR
jgi:hypothetical protein